MENEKKFLDTVHGYISVPESYCDEIIDTKHFQRLRRIEQSSARSLFPCARHDRFIHSLGVYHIGRRIVDAISNSEDIKDIDTKAYEAITTSYLLACLLHDCGHSPFSHTLEKEFGTKCDLFVEYVKALDRLDIEVPEEWRHDYDPSNAKQHEIISAYLCTTVFIEKIKKLNGDIGLIGRMIMGLRYKTPEKSLEDCFISLLNGKIIDADKLDYICRDQWALGYLSNAVDVDRLINGIMIHKGSKGYEIVFRKNAITEIQTVIDSKNFQIVNVFNHHQVKYEQWLLQKCVNQLKKSINGRLFDFHAIENTVTVDGIKLSLLSDDDIMHLMKSRIGDYSLLNEWLSRDYQLVPLWKSRSEFIAIFRDKGGAKLLSDGDGSLFETKIIPIVSKVFDGKHITLNAKPELAFIEEGDIKIDFGNGNIVDCKELNLPVMKDVYKDEVFSYIFVPKGLAEERYKAVIIAIKENIV